MSKSKADWAELNNALEILWNGPLENFRFGKFSNEEFDECKKAISSIDIGGCSSLDSRFVALLWFIPKFMEWQATSIEADDALARPYKNLCAWVNDRVMHILGGP